MIGPVGAMLEYGGATVSIEAVCKLRIMPTVFAGYVKFFKSARSKVFSLSIVTTAASYAKVMFPGFNFIFIVTRIKRIL